MPETMPYPLADHIRVHRDGRIESCLKLGRVSGKGDKWRPIKPQLKQGGYPCISIRSGGKNHFLRVHRVVAWAWHGAPEPGQICRHLDDNRLNFHADNLAWGTRADNTEDAKRNGKILSGEDSPVSKLSNHQREMIMISACTGGSLHEIAREFGVSYAAAHYVAYGRPNRGSGRDTSFVRTPSNWEPNWDRPKDLFPRKEGEYQPPVRPPVSYEPLPSPVRPGRGRKPSKKTD